MQAKQRQSIAEAALASCKQEIELKETIEETIVEFEVARQAEAAARAKAPPVARARLQARGPPSCLNRSGASSTGAAPARARPPPPFSSSFSSFSSQRNGTGPPPPRHGPRRHVTPGLGPARGSAAPRAAVGAGAGAGAGAGSHRAPRPFSLNPVLSPTPLREMPEAEDARQPPTTASEYLAEVRSKCGHSKCGHSKCSHSKCGHSKCSHSKCSLDAPLLTWHLCPLVTQDGQAKKLALLEAEVAAASRASLLASASSVAASAANARILRAFATLGGGAAAGLLVNPAATHAAGDPTSCASSSGLPPQHAVKVPSGWRHGALPWPPGAGSPGAWLRCALGTSGRASGPDVWVTG